MTEIYYVEDDEDIAGIVKEYLESRNFKVTLYRAAEEVKESLGKQRPDLILLDWNLPDEEGSRLCLWIRSRWQDLPLMFLTVRNETKDIVKGFQNGADDYVEKPFELEVLYSRICALLRRAGHVPGQTVISCGNLTIDKEKMMVFCGGQEVSVSRSEYQMLLILMEHKGMTVTRQRLLEKIWDENGNFVNDNTLTVAMKRLRQKLNQPACIKTIRSFGYRMEDEI